MHFLDKFDIIIAIYRSGGYAVNILHLKYAVEIANTKSISQAAENLYMGQPNLSRAIKELENNLGITIFERTTKGVTITAEGEEFLQHARRIIAQVEEMESYYQKGRQPRQKLSVCAPRASYVSAAWLDFCSALYRDQQIEIFYQETGNQCAVQNVLNGDYNLAIIRYQIPFEHYFEKFFQEKRLSWLTVAEFSYSLLMSEEHTLAGKDEIYCSDLERYIEISRSDPYVPTVPAMDVKRTEPSPNVDKHIYVFDRESQYEMLEKMPNTFMWASGVREDVLSKYALVQRPCVDNHKVHRDVLIFRKDYRLSELDRAFIQALHETKHRLLME